MIMLSWKTYPSRGTQALRRRTRRTSCAGGYKTVLLECLSRPQKSGVVALLVFMVLLYASYLENVRFKSDTTSTKESSRSTLVDKLENKGNQHSRERPNPSPNYPNRKDPQDVSHPSLPTLDESKRDAKHRIELSQSDRFKNANPTSVDLETNNGENASVFNNIDKQENRPKKRKDNPSPDSWPESEDTYFQDDFAPIADWDYFPERPQTVKEPVLETDWDHSKCDAFMESIDTSSPPRKNPTNHACDGFEGVLHIQHYDYGGGSGTAFFEINIAMLQWANQHNFIPFIHLDDYTWPIYDSNIHSQGPDTTFTMKAGMEIGWARDARDVRNHIFPGKPYVTEEGLHFKEFHLQGTGVWSHYFLPVSDFVPGDESCKNKPLVNFTDDLIVPGIHAYAPWAPRAWRHTDAPYLAREELSWDDWFFPQRMHAARIVQQYIRFNPYMEFRSKCSLQNTEFSLGMHIRHGDKVERKIIPVKFFLKYAKAFVKNGGGDIYVASDSSKVFQEIDKKWPKYVTRRVVRQPAVVALTPNETAAFDIGVSQHRSNVEALTDLLTLSKCTFLLHSMSALTEAALYLNPSLIDRSINFEDRGQRYKTVEYFVHDIMPRGRLAANTTEKLRMT